MNTQATLTLTLKNLNRARKRTFKRLTLPAGNAFCPVCNGSFKEFLPHGHSSEVFAAHNVVGGGYRKNGLCPICGATDRERLVLLYLQNETDFFDKPHRLLHIAPEIGLERVIRKLSHIEYLTADFLSPYVMEKMDITQIDYPDNTFDCILCNHVLEHVPNDLKAMQEIERVLKPGGWAILQVPIAFDLDDTLEDPSITEEEDRYRVFGQRDHVRLYGSDYKHRLEQAGLKVKLVESSKLNERERHLGLNPEEILHIAYKQSRV